MKPAKNNPAGFNLQKEKMIINNNFHIKFHEILQTYLGQMTFAQGSFDGQFLCKFLAIVAWPH